MTIERYQNPTVDSTINLRLFTYNSNTLKELYSIDSVEIYYLDREEISDTNPDGRRLVETFAGSAVTIEDTGTHVLEVSLSSPKYVIGQYLDIWTVRIAADEPAATIENVFDIYPNLLYPTKRKLWNCVNAYRCCSSTPPPSSMARGVRCSWKISTVMTASWIRRYSTPTSACENPDTQRNKQLLS